MKTQTSIVQKLVSRSVTGQGLGLSIHAHRGLTIHLSWNPGVRRGSYRSCIARHTVQVGVWRGIIHQLRNRDLKGVCKCVYGTVTGDEIETVDEFCFYNTYAGIRYYCRCRYEFSLEVGENYRTSLFLYNGCVTF